MKKVTLPTNFNEYNFAQLAKKEKNAALKVRYLALSYIQANKTVLEAAALVYKSSRMVHRWINLLNDFGIAGLEDKPGRGRKVELPENKEDEFRSIILEFQRKQIKSKLTGRDVQKLLKNHYSIDCTLPTAYNTLARLNLSTTQGNQQKKQFKKALKLNTK